MRKGLFVKKPIGSHFVETEGEVEAHQLKRHLGAGQLVAIGIGAIIGAGIFVITGTAAAEYAGPSIVISFILAAMVCLLTGLCYAELSSTIPVSGGVYSYSYVALGEFPAWLVGWVFIGQYLVSAATIAVGWAAYLRSFLSDFGINLPLALSEAPISYGAHGWGLSGAWINLPAIFIVLVVGTLISVGIKAVATFNNAMVAIKLSALVLFIVIGIFHIQTANWIPFIPENTGTFGVFGWSGVLRASGLVFFAYIGFDTVATLAQDAKNPQKDLPKGILGSLGICTVAYIITALVLTGVVSYKLLGVADPMSIALNAMGPAFLWFKIVVKLAILAGLSSVVLVLLLGLTRVFLAVSKDGLVSKRFSRMHPITKTPLFCSIGVSLVSMAIAAFFPVIVLGEIVSMTTLSLFSMACLSVLVLRKTHPHDQRPFKAPFVPWVPIGGILGCVAQMCFLPMSIWAQFVVWLVLGCLVYYAYGIHNSKLRKV